MHHDLKILSRWQHTIACGFQIRRNDRGFQENDTIAFHLWDADQEAFEGAVTPTVRVAEVHHDFPGVAPGYCVLIFNPPNPCRWRRYAEPILIQKGPHGVSEWATANAQGAAGSVPADTN